MPANDYKIFQAQILNKDPINPRQYTVVQIPDGYKLVGVQLPNALKDQSAPLLGSVVLVLQLDSYRAYILSILREPFNFLDANQQFRGFIPDVTANLANPIQDGEIFMEATGPASPTGEGTPGFGANLYLGNNGCAQIQSGSMGERLVVGGTTSDDDHEVVLSADNGFIESNPNEVTQVQSTFNWDSLNTLQLGNVLTNQATPVTIPISELTMDTLGNVTLRNTISGTGLDLGSLKLDISGNVTLASSIAGAPQSEIQLTNAGTIFLNPTSSLAAARITDTVTSTIAVDQTYWQFINAIQSFFTVLSGFAGGSPVVQSQLGALGQAFLIQSPIAPPSLTSKISSGSNTVFIG